MSNFILVRLFVFYIFLGVHDAFLRNPLSKCQRASQFYSKNIALNEFTGTPSVLGYDSDKNIVSVQFKLAPYEVNEVINKCCSVFSKIMPESNITPFNVEKMFGNDKINSFCCKLLEPSLREKCTAASIPVGSMSVVDRPDLIKHYDKQNPLILNVECSMLPDVQYEGGGYRGLDVEIRDEQAVIAEKMLEIKRATLSERATYSEVSNPEYRVKEGDMVVLKVAAYPLYYEYAEAAEGEAALLVEKTRGERIRKLSQKSKKVSVGPDSEYFAPIVKKLVGRRTGDQFTVEVTMPPRKRSSSSSDDDESDTTAIAASGSSRGRDVVVSFDVEVLKVSEMKPVQWNNDLANSIEEGLSIRELEAQMRDSVGRELRKTAHLETQQAAEKALLKCINGTKIPASLLDFRVREQFKRHLREWAESDQTTEDPAKLVDLYQRDENMYRRYRQEAGSSVERSLKLELAYRDIFLREGLKIDKQEADRQIGKSKELALGSNTVYDEAAVRAEVMRLMIRRAVLTFLLLNSNTIEV